MRADTARRGRRRIAEARFIVVTGLSGSGKSQAIRALEDLGVFCVDNLPTTLIPTFARLTRRAGTPIGKAAVVVDVREGGFLSQFPTVFRRLRAIPGLNPVLIFLEASDAALVRRFSETRRPHPLAPDRSVIEGIRDERARMAPIRRMAQIVIDTSDMTVHELRQQFMELSRGEADKARLAVTIVSFGYKYGLPLDADVVFDVRFLPNPHFVARLRRYTGKDAPVRRYLSEYGQTRELLDRLGEFLQFLVPHYVKEGKNYLTVAIGCTGGKHRSVAVAEAMRRKLAGLPNVRLRVRHRDIANE